jgi:uridine kinase
MRGDKLVILEHHIRAAGFVKDALLKEVLGTEGKYGITVAGESGSGKSEIAEALAEHLRKEGVKSIILQQDDYFVYPPKTNSEMRKQDISLVGLSEVKLDLLERNLQDYLDGKPIVEKPLVDFDQDKIETEELAINDAKVVIIEGTYTTLICNANRHVFIDIDYFGTRKARERRAREEQDDFLEKILKIEHEIIAANKPKADIIIDENYQGRMADGK